MATSVKTLEMIFEAFDGRRVTIRVLDPREDLQGSEVKAVMEDIIAKDIFSASTGASLTDIYAARIVQRDVNPVELPA